jgi:hypothetical protein
LRRTIGISVVCAAGLFAGLTSYAPAQTAVNHRVPARADVLPPLSPLANASGADGAAITNDVQTFPLNVPAYNSNPSANAKIYLDFDGDFTATWGTYHPGTTPAYDTDGDATTFTADELVNIQQIFLGIAEEFSPFNVNVTTVNPGTLTDYQSMWVVIGGDGKIGPDTYWTGARAGGIGYLGSFGNPYPNTVYVFPGNLRNGTPRFSAMAAAHETGHAFGLEHHSEYRFGARVQEYSDNDPTTTGDGPGHYSAQPTAPIMGVSYFAARGLWFNSDSTYEGNLQDDLGIITTRNGFGYRADDHSNSIVGATPLSLVGPFVVGHGIIENTEDQDFFHFTVTEDSNALLQVLGSAFNQMLDPSLALYSSDGTLLDLQATSALSETITAMLTPGTYNLAVSSAGNYGDIGQFTFSGWILPVPEPATGAVVLLTLLLGRRNRSRTGV